MEKDLINFIGKSSVIISFIFNLIEWQTINIIFTCALSLLSCIFIILKICSWFLDMKMKKENSKNENNTLKKGIRHFIKRNIY